MAKRQSIHKIRQSWTLFFLLILKFFIVSKGEKWKQPTAKNCYNFMSMQQAMMHDNNAAFNVNSQ